MRAFLFYFFNVLDNLPKGKGSSNKLVCCDMKCCSWGYIFLNFGFPLKCLGMFACQKLSYPETNIQCILTWRDCSNKQNKKSHQKGHLETQQRKKCILKEDCNLIPCFVHLENPWFFILQRIVSDIWRLFFFI